MNNRLYFAADDGIHGRELWVTDGSISGTSMIADLEPGSASSFPDFLTEFNGELLFTTTSSLYKFNDAVLGLNDIDEDNSQIYLYPNPVDNFLFN